MPRRPAGPASSGDRGTLPRATAIAAARAAVHRSRAAAPPAPRGAAGTTQPPSRPAGDASLTGPGAPGAPSAADGRRAGAHRPAWHTAVRERLPLWLQLRCGVEPRTLAALAVVLLVAVGFAVHHFWNGLPETVRPPEAAAAAPAAATASSGPRDTAAAGSGQRIIVDVAGDVREPGVHRLPSGARVADALEAAGGVKPGTGTDDLGALNQARRLVDGEQIVVGSAAPAPPGSRPGQSGAGQAAAGAGARISLTSASAEELETLPGVGPVLAQHIIDYRTQHGGFTSLDELREVNGIGEARFADIEPRVTL